MLSPAKLQRFIENKTPQMAIKNAMVNHNAYPKRMRSVTFGEAFAICIKRR